MKRPKTFNDIKTVSYTYNDCECEATIDNDKYIKNI